MYYRARYYEPPLGVFSSGDPMLNRPLSNRIDASRSFEPVLSGQGGPLHAYKYADGNPTLLVDPSGKIAIVTNRPSRVYIAGAEPLYAGAGRHYFALDEDDVPKVEQAIRILLQWLAFKGDCQHGFRQAKTKNRACTVDGGEAAVDVFNQTEIWHHLTTDLSLLGQFEPTSPPIVGITSIGLAQPPFRLAGIIIHEMAHHYTGPHPASPIDPYEIEANCLR
jgi:RHS repeat-associated protein